MKPISVRPGSRRQRFLPHAALIGILLLCGFHRAGAQAPAPSSQLASLLQRLGKKVELFQQQFPATKCTEKISQVKLGQKGKIVLRQESQWDYLILMKLLENDLIVEESRIVTKQSDKKTNSSLLVSGGFSTLILIFHPLYQSSFEFMEMPEETVGGSSMVRIHFRHVPGTRSTAALHLESRDLPLDLTGDAWILPESASIVRIAAELSAPLPELGLRTLSADVRYAPIHFSSAEGVYWLPASAAIEVATTRQHWRNTHQFEDYRCFSVSSGSAISR